MSPPAQRDPRDVLTPVLPVGSYPHCKRQIGCISDPATGRCVYCDKVIDRLPDDKAVGDG